MALAEVGEGFEEVEVGAVAEGQGGGYGWVGWHDIFLFRFEIRTVHLDVLSIGRRSMTCVNDLEVGIGHWSIAR